MSLLLISSCFLVCLVCGGVGYYIRSVQYPATDIRRVGLDTRRKMVANKWLDIEPPPAKHTHTETCVYCGSEDITTSHGHIHKNGEKIIASFCRAHESVPSLSKEFNCDGCYGIHDYINIVTD